MYLVFVINIISLLVSIFIGIKLQYTSKKSSTILTYALKMMSIYASLLNTVLVIPFFNAFFSIIFCSENSLIHKEIICYNGIYYWHLSVSILGIILLIFFSFLFSILFIDINPNSTLPFASPQTYTIFYKLFLKIFLPLYFTIDYQVNL